MSTKDSRKFTFKSVGEVTQPLEQIEDGATSFFPIGIKFPVQAAAEVGSTFEMTTDLKLNVRQNFKAWIKTNWGERLGEYNFGANLVQLLPELVQNNNQNAIRDSLASGISVYFPYIKLENFQVLSFEETPSFDIYSVRIIYSAPDVFDGFDSISLVLRYVRV